jgi:pimeloyl-ACP methyl ester carboxylesterase
MVDFVANDTREWQLAIQFARQRGDTALVARLESYGPPPYHDNPAAKIQTLDDVVGAEATRHGAGGWPGTFAALLASPEYGLLDKVMLPINTLRVMNQVYPQLYHVDLRTQSPTLQVPVYLLEGRYDYNAVNTLAVDYYNTLTAPHKELIWFEHSGHNVLPSEPDKVEDVLVNHVLAQTQPDR